ncbi:MAG: hypothetical protein PHE67_12090 [Campylobacterales bacterium]|nr:hypothetical protein [Campylobacterales bacterium]
MKPKSILEAEIMIDIHIREKNELKDKIQKLEKLLSSSAPIRTANGFLIRKIKELEFELQKSKIEISIERRLRKELIYRYKVRKKIRAISQSA